MFVSFRSLYCVFLVSSPLTMYCTWSTHDIYVYMNMYVLIHVYMCAYMNKLYVKYIIYKHTRPFCLVVYKTALGSIPFHNEDNSAKHPAFTIKTTSNCACVRVVNVLPNRFIHMSNNQSTRILIQAKIDIHKVHYDNCGDKASLVTCVMQHRCPSYKFAPTDEF